MMNSEKDKFFSIIAHDLRGPLANVMSLSEIIEDEIEDNKTENLAEYANYIKKSASKSMDLLSNLMGWARAQIGNLKLEKVAFKINDLIKRNIQLLSDTASQKEINFQYESKDLLVHADKNMIDLVIRNLISNAVKFSNSGDSIKLESKIENKQLIVSVSDSGIGMNDEMIQNLFKIDAKVGRPGTDGESSSGLGLLLCKEFVSLHKGEIWVESAVGQGSTFYFSIPID